MFARCSACITADWAADLLNEVNEVTAVVDEKLATAAVPPPRALPTKARKAATQQRRRVSNLKQRLKISNLTA